MNVADIVVGAVFFTALGFALKRVVNHFKSGKCSACSDEPAETSCGSCPHCKANA